MKKFMNEDFLLSNETSKRLYEKAKNLPIIDYHCHLNPKEIAENKKFKNITEMWLYGDHYKWRAMRSNGINEKYITGDGSDYEKFEKWAESIEECIGNPLYHWTHLELKRYFKYDGILNSKTAKQVWEHCNNIINSGEFCVKKILKDFSVENICTTDDPIDNLEHHKKIKEDKTNETLVLPTFRPSMAMNIESPEWANYIGNLSKATDKTIESYDHIVDALYERITFFNENGCKLSDHSLDSFAFEHATKDELNSIVVSALKNETLSQTDIKKFKTAVLVDLCKKYYEYNWTMQLHAGCLRNVNTKMYNILGADTGFDCIDDAGYALSLAKTLDKISCENSLPKTIIYCLNPIHNEMIATICGCFQDGNTRGKIQFGSGWWFNDQKDGMEKQMIALGNLGLLSRFVGMLTDSRSFLSYTRHEYFRRILCNLIGTWVENGEFPDDEEQLTKIVSNISYYNAKEYFNFVLPK